MTEQQHPITPTPELVRQWIQSWYDAEVKNVGVTPHAATQAAIWGADQELEACCEWLREARNHGFGYDMGRILADNLRAARRPKPPSLAEQALLAIDTAVADNRISAEVARVIRAALERLQELEGKQ